MKIKYLILLILLVLPITLAIMPYPYPQTGINQQYSVNFDDEGEATVAAKIDIQNYEKDLIKKIQLEIPGRGIRMINSFQEIYEYDERCIDEVKDCNDDKTICEVKCERYSKHQRWPPIYKVIDYSINQLSNSVLYNLELPESVEEGERAVIILYYKSESYAEKSLGVWKFDFETIKINYDTSNVNVGISVNNNLHLKGIKSNIEYLDNSMFSSELKTTAVEEMSRFSGSIGSGYYNENAQSLDPMESFKVKGSYSKSLTCLYVKQIFFGLVIVLLLVLGAVYTFKKIKNKNMKFVLTGIGASFISITLWILTYFFIRFLNRMIYYPMYPLISLIFVITVVLISLFIIFGPAIYFGFKYGVKGLIIYSVSFLISLVIFGVIGTFILYLLNPKPISPIYRLMEATVG